MGDKKLVSVDCKLHGRWEVAVFYVSDHWSLARCPQCAELNEVQRLAEIERSEKRRKDDAKQRLIKSNLGNSGIPTRFTKHSLDTYIPTNDKAASHLAYCKGYAENFPKYLEQGTSLIFCGETGTGKTHLSCGIANYIIKNHMVAVVFINVVKAIRQVKETYSKGNDKTEQEAINWFLNPDLLILDEVGVQFGTDAEKLILFEIINERYEAVKPTILISNLTVKDMIGYTGDRVMDRMKENGGKHMVFNWKSHRHNK